MVNGEGWVSEHLSKPRCPKTNKRIHTQADDLILTVKSCVEPATHFVEELILAKLVHNVCHEISKQNSSDFGSEFSFF